MTQLRYLITKIPSLSLYKVNCIYNMCEIGSLSFTIQNNMTIINNIIVTDRFRRKGFGSIFVKNIETYTKFQYNCKVIKLTAYQADSNTNVYNFFEKNGYKMQKQNIINKFDDGKTIFNLQPYFKII